MLARHHRVAVLVDEVGVRLVPVRPLPAGGLEEERAELLLRLVHRRLPLVAVRLVLLGGVDDPVGLDERLGRAQSGVLAALLVLVEPGDVAVGDVDLAVALGHPLGHRAADARTFLDPDRGRGPESLDLALAEDRGAVAGERQQPVDRVAHLGAVGAEQVGHQLVGLLELRVEVVVGERQLGRGQLRLVDRGDVLGLHQDRAVGVGADLHVGAVLTLVAERVHVAHDRERDLALVSRRAAGRGRR